MSILAMSIFDAFPNGIVSGVWSIGKVKRGSVAGNVFEKVADLDVVVDEGNNSSISTTPEAITPDFLIYAKPEQLPTLSSNVLVSTYMLTDGNHYYDITSVGIGKNQETGKIEHVELGLTQTEASING